MVDIRGKRYMLGLRGEVFREIKGLGCLGS
jgi:hypothetical protein